MTKNEKALRNIKAVVDAYKEGRITLTMGNDDFDALRHVYDVSVVMGIIENHTKEGLKTQTERR